MHPSNLIENYIRGVKIKEVWSGDDVSVIVDLGWGVSCKERMHLKGIRAPMVKTKDDNEVLNGIRAREALEQVLRGAEKIIVHSHEYQPGTDYPMKGILYADGMNVNEFMVANDFAVAIEFD